MTTTTTTQIATIDVTVPAEWYGDFAADFDTEAIDAEYQDALQAAAREIAPSITVHANGMIIADIEDADAARAIDWRALAEQIDVSKIAQRHERNPLTS